MGSKDATINNASLLHLRDVGVRSGPWDEQNKKIRICTDRSLGLGRHYADNVSLHLGLFGFGHGRHTTSWFDELMQASSQTKYGILILCPSDRYLSSRACRTELRC